MLRGWRSNKACAGSRECCQDWHRSLTWITKMHLWNHSQTSESKRMEAATVTVNKKLLRAGSLISITATGLKKKRDCKYGAGEQQVLRATLELWALLLDIGCCSSAEIEHLTRHHRGNSRCECLDFTESTDITNTVRDPLPGFCLQNPQWNITLLRSRVLCFLKLFDCFHQSHHD